MHQLPVLSAASASNKCCQNTNKTLILLDLPPSREYPLTGSYWMCQVQEKPFFKNITKIATVQVLILI
jgi:hypothetical protein